MVERPRVLLAGGATLSAESVGRLLAPTCDVVGRVNGGGDPVTAAEQLRADVIVFDREALAGMRSVAAGGSNGHELTPRQREVLCLLASGQSMKEAGQRLNIAARTIAFHKYQIMERLGITSNAELIRYAVRHALV